MKQYEFLLDISDACLSMISRDYTYLITNRAFCEALDLEKEKIIGKSPRWVWGEETFRKIIKPYLDESFKSREIRYTRWFEVPGKGERFFEVIFRPHTNSQGEVDFVLVSSRERTSEEKARVQLLQKQQDLEMVNTVNRLYSEGKSEAEISSIIVNKISHMFNAFAANIFIADDPDTVLRPLKFFLPRDKVKEMNVAVDTDRIKGFGKRSAFRRIMKGKKVLHITRPEKIWQVIRELTDDHQVFAAIISLLKKNAVSSLLVVPLVRDNENIGVLGIAREMPFTEEEIGRIRKLGYQIILVLKRIKEERLLKENERSLEEAQRISQLGDWSWDLKNDRVRWSREFFRILEYDIRKIKPSIINFSRRIHPDDRSRVLKKIIDATRQCKKRCLDQFRLLMPDGTVKYVSSTGVLERSGDEPLKWHGTIHDITPLKKVEQQLRHQARELSLINRLNLELNRGTSLEQINHIFFEELRTLYPIEHMIVFLREPFDENFHLAYSAMPQKTGEMLRKSIDVEMFYTIPVEGFERFIEKMKQENALILLNDESNMRKGMGLLFGQKRKYIKALDILGKLGLKSQLFYPVMSGDKLLGFINLNSIELLSRGQLENLSSILEQVVMVFLKKISEDEIQRLYDAIEQLSEVLIISDRNGTILYVNKAVQNIFGYERDTIVGKDIRSMRYSGEDPAFYENIWETVLQGKTWSGMHRILHSNGETIKARSHITPIRDDQGNLLYFVTILQDITREITLEHYLQRTHKLEMMGRFAGGLAHDFNNILATIMGYVDMAMDEEEKGSPAYRYLNKARSSGQKAGEVIRKLLTFNRGIDPEMQVLDLAAVIRETFEILRPQIPSHIKTSIENHCESSTILADPAQMRQVFMNLLSNAVYAVKKRKDGYIRVSLDIMHISEKNNGKYPELREGKWLCVTVTDNGEGIPQEVMDRVFDPFYTTKPVGEGSGMGLSIVHGIIHNHKGVIHLDSETDKGTAFRVFLPVE